MAYEALPLDILPGVFKEASEYAAQGRYVDADNVRWWKGFPERIGGNSRAASEHLYRPPRGMHGWRSLSDAQFIAFGHSRGVQVLQGGSLTNVSPEGTGGYATLTVAVGVIAGGPYQTGETVTTPNGATGTLVQASAVSPLFVSGDNGTLKVNLSGISGAFLAGERVTFSGGGSARVLLGGSSTPIYCYDETGTLTGTLTGAISGATATVSSTAVLWTGVVTGGTSGATSTISSVVETNLETSASIVSYGEETWGAGVWGGYDVLLSTTVECETWSFATWGEDLIACPREGKIYSFDVSVFLGAPTTNLTLISQAPSSALGIFMNDANRTLIAYGAHDGSNADPLNLRWCDEEDYTVWTPSAANTAGSLRCENGSTIIGRMAASGGHLISTDTAIYLFRFIGLPFVFSLVQIASGCAMISPNAGAEQDGVTYWMGSKGFYVYNGSVSPVACDVHNYVFDRLNAVQGFKVYCGTNRQFNEIWWFYCSAGAEEIDSVVVFNTLEKHWWIGSKARTSWIDTGVVFAYPTGAKADGSIHVEEYGDTDNGASIPYTLSTSDIEVADGGTFLHARKVIVDFDEISGTHQLSIEARGWPARSATTKGPFPLTSATEQVSVRVRGRTLRFLMSGSTPFRIGRFRTRVTGHGRKP